MTTHSRPLSDYKKTSIMMDCLKQYERLSHEVLEILEKFKNPTLTTDEVNLLNIDLNNMEKEMNDLIINMSQYGGKI